MVQCARANQIHFEPEKEQGMPGKPKSKSLSTSAKHWLVKSEPHVFSVDDLAACENQITCWDGVRNYQARNMLRDDMKLRDQVLFYHSNTDEPAIVGLTHVIREGYPDHTAFDSRDPHFDAKSDPEHPRWYMVDIKLDTIFAAPLSLNKLRTVPALEKMELLRRGSRLSVQPVRPEEFAVIMQLVGQ